MRVQNRLHGRVPAHAGLHPDVEKWIRSQMRRFNASRSFVISTLCTDQYERVTKHRIENQTRFDHPVEVKRRRRSA